MSEITYRFFYAGIIFNLLFSVFGFAFTAFPTTGNTEIDIPLDADTLYQEGIIFVNATYFNLTYNGNWTYFSQAERNMRIGFREAGIDPLVQDGITIQQQGLVQQYFDSWLLPTTLQIEVGPNYRALVNPKNLGNSTIVQYWENDYNWTRFRTLNSITGFVTTIPADNNNISKAVYETGILTITIGELQVLSDIDILTFARWYWNTIFSFGYSGFPSVLSWVLKLIVIINFVTGVIVIRDLFRV